MKSIELTEKYLNIIFSGKNLDELESILASDLIFSGPWYKFNTSLEYINSLKKQPFESVRYNIIKSFGDDTTSCVIYQMSAHGLTAIPMLVYTTIERSRISSILLIFDSRRFQKNDTL